MIPKHAGASSAALLLATRALADGLRLLNAAAHISDEGYVRSIEDNLIPGVTADQFKDDLDKGDGNELKAKFKAAHSSCALVVNCFAPFVPLKDAPSDLAINGVSGFQYLNFERKCRALRGGTPPNLDLVAEGVSEVVAVESKCTEYLSQTEPAFSPAYARQIRDERRDGRWFVSMQEITKQPAAFVHLDVAQLIKHAFGLARCFKGKSVTLLYLFWEPADAVDFEVFAQHREEIVRFTEMVTGGFPSFEAMSYPELWSSWSSQAGRPIWILNHISNLRKRYLVSLAPQ
jgi:hypothetical protein